MSVYHSMRRSTAADDADDEDLIVVNLTGHGVVMAQSPATQPMLTHEQAEALVEAHPVSTKINLTSRHSHILYHTNKHPPKDKLT